MEDKKDNLENGMGTCDEGKCIGVVEESDLEARCPYCHSTDVRRVSHLYKVVDLLLRGLYAVDRIGIKWHCNNCGKDF